MHIYIYIHKQLIYLFIYFVSYCGLLIYWLLRRRCLLMCIVLIDWILSVRSVSIISIFEFSIWESQIRTNQLWMIVWHDVGFQCARVSSQRNTMKFRKSTVSVNPGVGSRCLLSERECFQYIYTCVYIYI